MGQAFVNRGGEGGRVVLELGRGLGEVQRLFERPFVTAHPCRGRAYTELPTLPSGAKPVQMSPTPISSSKESNEGPGDFLRHVGRSGFVMNYSTAKVHVADIPRAQE